MGVLKFDHKGKWTNTETITMHPDDVGIMVNNLTGKEVPTSVFIIKYSKKGVHIAPGYPSKKGAKMTQ